MKGRWWESEAYRPCSIILSGSAYAPNTPGGKTAYRLAVASAPSASRFRIDPRASKLTLSYTCLVSLSVTTELFTAYLSTRAHIVLAHSSLQHSSPTFHLRPLMILQSRLKLLDLLIPHDILQQHLPQHPRQVSSQIGLDSLVSVQSGENAGSLWTGRGEDGGGYG